MQKWTKKKNENPYSRRSRTLRWVAGLLHMTSQGSLSVSEAGQPWRRLGVLTSSRRSLRPFDVCTVHHVLSCSRTQDNIAFLLSFLLLYCVVRKHLSYTVYGQFIVFLLDRDRCLSWITYTANPLACCPVLFPYISRCPRMILRCQRLYMWSWPFSGACKLHDCFETWFTFQAWNTG
jgi:hypothetical protein